MGHTAPDKERIAFVLTAGRSVLDTEMWRTLTWMFITLLKAIEKAANLVLDGHEGNTNTGVPTGS